MIAVAVAYLRALEAHGVALDDARKALRDGAERLRPCDAGERAVRLPQHGMQQAAVEAERLVEGGAFGAEPAKIRRVRRIAGNRRAGAVGPSSSSMPCAAVPPRKAASSRS